MAFVRHIDGISDKLVAAPKFRQVIFSQFLYDPGNSATLLVGMVPKSRSERFAEGGLGRVFTPEAGLNTWLGESC